jgi:class 3 adenylate cyclase
VRVGIATYPVVVGDLVGSGEAQERGVVGETPTLAARLQAIAEPDTVVIADGIRRLLPRLAIVLRKIQGYNSANSYLWAKYTYDGVVIIGNRVVAPVNVVFGE